MTRICTSLPPILSTPPPLLLSIIRTPTQIQNSIVTAKWNRKRSRPHRSNRLIIKSIATVASSLKVLPEPIDLIVREFASSGGGNGGKFWFRNGSGGGGFDGWRRRNNGRRLGLWLLVLVGSGIALWVTLEKEVKNDDMIWIFSVGLIFVVYCIWVDGLKNRGMVNLAIGFCCGATVHVVGLGMKNEDYYVKWMEKFRANSLISKVIGKRTRRNRRVM